MINQDQNSLQSQVIAQGITAAGALVAIFVLTYAINSIVKAVKGEEPPPPPEIPYYPQYY